MNLFEKMFDFNRDGKLDLLEQAAEAAFVCSTFAENNSDESEPCFEADEEEIMLE